MPVALPRSAWSSRRGVVPFIAAVTLAALLSGCGPAETDLQQAVARQLQSRVMRVSEAAAAGDRDAALKALDFLAVDLETSAGKGERSRQTASGEYPPSSPPSGQTSPEPRSLSSLLT